MGTKSASDTAPARAATVTLQGGKLTVDANNSDLEEILHRVATVSGMSINGLDQDARVFGIYGPGNPRDVLTALLTDAGYNFMMVGQTDAGAPRELLLTDRQSGPLPPPAPAAAGADERNGDQAATPQNEQQPRPALTPPSAPAPAQPAPPAAPVTAPDTDQQVQQTIQRLQQMHDQQQQQQQDSAPPPQ